MKYAGPSVVSSASDAIVSPRAFKMRCSSRTSWKFFKVS